MNNNHFQHANGEPVVAFFLPNPYDLSQIFDIVYCSEIIIANWNCWSLGFVLPFITVNWNKIHPRRHFYYYIDLL